MCVRKEKGCTKGAEGRPPSGGGHCQAEKIGVVWDGEQEGSSEPTG
jgi:hypothetical protein